MRQSLIGALRETADEVYDEVANQDDRPWAKQLVEMLRLAATRLEKYHDQTLFGDTDG